MAGLRGIFSTIKELFEYLLRRKRWWMLPMIVLLLLAGILIILGSTAGVGPLIYTLF